MFKIWVIEDDITLCDEILIALRKWGYEAKGIADFYSIKKTFLEYNPHLILMDINLPTYDGYHWCRELRQISKVPILFISSRDTNMDIVMAINMGGDDFISKPFDLDVMVAKIKAQLRRTYSYDTECEMVEHRGVILNLSEGKLIYDNENVELTRNELKIFSVLMRGKKKIISRNDIMKVLWDDDQYVNENTLTVNINRLRAKLNEIGLEGFIQTKKGIGYVIQ